MRKMSNIPANSDTGFVAYVIIMNAIRRMFPFCIRCAQLALNQHIMKVLSMSITLLMNVLKQVAESSLVPKHL